MNVEIYQLKEIFSMLRATKVECKEENCFYHTFDGCGLKDTSLGKDGKCEKFILKKN